MSFAQSVRIALSGVEFDAITEDEAVGAVRAALDRGEGGRVVTPNVDILRLAETDPQVRDYLDGADLVVADGMPLIWASRLAGTPLPQRVAGSDLIWSLSYGLGQDGRSVYLLGGEPGTAGAARAAAVLDAGCPGLRIAGFTSPEYGFENSADDLDAVLRDVVAAAPDLVFVGIGFPKQEWLINRLREALPTAWYLGCGAAINFVAGDRRRAPVWMRRSGLEWAHRMASEPGRLANRYLRHDAPYAMRLLTGAARYRFSRTAEAPERAVAS